MPASRPRLRAAAIGVSVFALAAVAAGGTFAAINPATLYACYDAYGNVRMWNATLNPGVADRWVLGGGEEFHAVFGVIPGSTTDCRVVATY